jgi:hypothetical protein
MKDGPKSGCIFSRQHIFAAPPPLFQRRPPILQNIQCGISQQPLIRYSSNFKIKLMEQTGKKIII